MTDNFKRVRELGLTFVPMYTIHSTGMKSESGPMMVYATELESLLEKATVVYGKDDAKAWFEGPTKDRPDVNFVRWETHTALLINVRPIVKDSAESLLREMVRVAQFGHRAELDALTERAKALLGKP